MKRNLNKLLFFAVIAILFAGCGSKKSKNLLPENMEKCGIEIAVHNALNQLPVKGAIVKIYFWNGLVREQASISTTNENGKTSAMIAETRLEKISYEDSIQWKIYIHAIGFKGTSIETTCTREELPVKKVSIGLQPA